MPTIQGRLVHSNETVLTQADFVQNDGYTRTSGLTVSDIQSVIFCNNVAQPWMLVDGTATPDQQVVAGKIYFNEIPGSPGYYAVRFRPYMVGYWRLVVKYGVGLQASIRDFDVIPQPTSPSESGLIASFLKS